MSNPNQQSPELRGFTHPSERFDLGDTVMDTSRVFFRGLSMFCKVVLSAPFGPAVPQSSEQAQYFDYPTQPQESIRHAA